MSGEDLKSRFQLSTLAKIAELHRVMFTANKRLVFYEFEGEEGAQKHLSTRPWMWPVLYRGCPAHASQLHSLYFVGSPQVYSLNLAVLLLLPVMGVFCAFQRARQTRREGETESERRLRDRVGVGRDRAGRAGQGRTGKSQDGHGGTAGWTGQDEAGKGISQVRCGRGTDMVYRP